MTEEYSSKCPEKNDYAPESEATISQNQVDSINFEQRAPLDLGFRHVILPQKNTAVKYQIPNVGERVSKRFIAVVFDDSNSVVSIRTIGVPSLTAMGFAEDVVNVDANGNLTGRSEAPAVNAEMQDDGSYKAERGSYRVHAMDDHSFIRGEELRYVVKEPTVIIPTRRARVWGPAFNEGKMVVENGKVALSLNERFYFYAKGTTPSEELVELAKKAIEDDPIKKFFYPL